LLEQAKLHDAIPFDAPKIEAIKPNHRGSRCSFEAILEDYAVADMALQKLALGVRAADVKGQESAAPEGIGLRSTAHGSLLWVARMRSAYFSSFLSTMPCTLMCKATDEF